MDSFKKIIEILQSEQNFLLLSHAMPDGDAIGSTLALGMALQKMGKQVVMVNADRIPQMYAFLPGIDLIKQEPERENDGAVVVLLDCAVPERLDHLTSIAKSAPFVINIDHHVSNTAFGHLNFVDATASATGEIVFAVIKQLGVPLDRAIGAALYTAIATDTGSFHYANVTARTHRVIAEVLETGLQHHLIMTKLFETRSLAETRLLAAVLATLEISDDHRIAALTITREMLHQLGTNDINTEGVINYARAIEGVEVGILYRELEDGRIKVGLRSQDLVNVDLIAAQFGGGGHAKAAGCILTGKLDEVKQKLTAAIAARIGEVIDGRRT